MKIIKIAIIDEDKKALGELEEILETIGYDPIAVNDTLLAVDIVAQRKPDVILMELKMPHKNWFELANEMNQVFEPQRIPIIAMSGTLKDDPSSLMNLCGINNYLKKPFHPLNVIWAIENATEEYNRLGCNKMEINRLENTRIDRKRWLERVVSL